MDDFFTQEELEAATAEDLEKYNQKLMAEKDAIRDEQKKVGAELSRRQALAAYNAMSDVERAHLHQVVKAIGVVGVHKVGGA